MTLERAPEDATHWSTRAMAKRCGLSQTMTREDEGGVAGHDWSTHECAENRAGGRERAVRI
jgi:hypothetical protein